jgi:hypothetical protein
MRMNKKSTNTHTVGVITIPCIPGIDRQAQPRKHQSTAPVNQIFLDLTNCSIELINLVKIDLNQGVTGFYSVRIPSVKEAYILLFSFFCQAADRRVIYVLSRHREVDS